MKLRRTKPFLKDYTKLHPALRKKVDRQTRFLANDLRHPSLYAKKMGVANIWEARLDKHNRFTFQIIDDKIILRRVGTHDILKKP